MWGGDQYSCSSQSLSFLKSYGISPYLLAINWNKYLMNNIWFKIELNGCQRWPLSELSWMYTLINLVDHLLKVITSKIWFKIWSRGEVLKCYISVFLCSKMAQISTFTEITPYISNFGMNHVFIGGWLNCLWFEFGTLSEIISFQVSKVSDLW